MEESTFNQYIPPNDLDKTQETEKNTKLKNFWRNNKKKIIISGVILGILVVAGVIIVIAVVLNSDSKNNKDLSPTSFSEDETDKNEESTDQESNKDNDDDDEKEEEEEDDDQYDEPIFIEISYNKDELRLFSIEKNISSIIHKENGTEEQKSVFKYNCVFGIKNSTNNLNEIEDIYEGFFAILSKIYHNISTNEETLLINNNELSNIINNKTEQPLLRNLGKYDSQKTNNSNNDDDIEEEALPFLKLEFYKNGSYKNIFRPVGLSESNYTEMKEFLDVIIPQINNDTFRKKSLLERLSLLREKRLNLLNNYKKRYIRFRRINDINENNTNNSFIQKCNNSDDYIDLDYSFNDHSDLVDGEENLYSENDGTIRNFSNNSKLMKIKKSNLVYAENTKFRGSNRDIEIKTILDSNNTVKEIFSKSYLNLTKQDFKKQTDREVYDSNNYLKEENLLINETNIDIRNISNDSDIIDENETENITDIIYNMSDANSMYSIIEQHIILNISYYKREIIKEIYDNYLDNFIYEENNNETLRMLRALQDVLPIKDLNNIEIIELDNKILRKLEEEQNKKYYGIKRVANRKNVFQTNFLGLDIALGVANTYIPGTGKSSLAFKLDLGDYKVSHELKSFSTNQHIITENIQQMSFKLLQLMYITHLNFEEQNKIYKDKINSNINILLENDVLKKNLTIKYSDINDFYDLIDDNFDLFKNKFDYFINNLTKINNDLNEKNNLINVSMTEEILENYFTNYTTDITEEMNIKINNINQIILKIEEIINENITDNLFTINEINSIIEQIKSFLNNELKNNFITQFNDKKYFYNITLGNRINNIMNLNQIKFLQYIFENNNIFNHLTETEERNFILSNITQVINKIQDDKNTLINLFNDLYNKMLENSDISNINSHLIELNDTKTINITPFETIEYQTVNEYFKDLEKIDEIKNEIITENIEYYSDILSNESNYYYDLINNMSSNFQYKMIETGKLLRNDMLKIKSNKEFNIQDFHNEYFENNMFNFYRITNEKDEYIINENEKKFSSFDYDFMNSIIKLMIQYGQEQIDYNFKLAYEYLNEAIEFVNECLEENDCEIDTVFDYFFNLFKSCDCEYYINIDFIIRLTRMSVESYEKVINYLNSDEFFDIVKRYYYSFKEELDKKEILLEEDLINNYNLSYFENTKVYLKFNFDLVKENIITQTIYDLKNYGLEKRDSFMEKFDKFNDNREGILTDEYYDIEIDGLWFFDDEYECPHRRNYLYVGDSSIKILSHLYDSKTIIRNNLDQNVGKYYNFYINYYKDLINYIQIKSDDINNDEILNLYFDIEKYSHEIFNFLNNITSDNFLHNIINEYQNSINNNNLEQKIEYLNNITNNFSQIYYQFPFIAEEENISEKNEMLNYLNYSQEISFDRFISFIEKLINNNIDIIEDLNKKILNFITLRNDELENITLIISQKFDDIEEMISDLKSNFINNIKNINNNHSLRFLDESDNFIDDESDNLLDDESDNLLDDESDNLLDDESDNLLDDESDNFFDDESGFTDYMNDSEFIDSTIIDSSDIDTIINFDDEKIAEYIKEQKISKKINKLKKFIYNNKFSLEINKDKISFIDINKINLISEHIKLNITKQANHIKNDFYENQVNETLRKYALEIINQETENIKEKGLKELLNEFNKLIPELDYNYSEDIANELNILYSKLFYYIGKSINLNYEKDEINFKNENETYFNKIFDFIRDIKIPDKNLINNTNIILESTDINTIIFILIKRIKEKQINNIKSYLNNYNENYENLNIENNLYSSLSKFYEEYKRINLISSYNEIYKETINSTSILKLDKLNINKTKISEEKIKEMIINIYQDNFNIFKNDFKYDDDLYKLKNDELTNLLNVKIENIISQIKNVIEQSLTGLDKFNLDNYFLKNHIINYFEFGINKNELLENKNFDKYFKNNLIKIEYLKLKEEKFYSKKIKDVLLDNFNIFFVSWINSFDMLFERNIINHHYFTNLMIDYSQKYVEYELDNIKILIEYSQILGINLNYKLNDLSDILYNIIIKKITNISFSSSFGNNSNILVEALLNNIFNEEFMKNISLTNNLKNLFYYDNDIYSSLRKFYYFKEVSFNINIKNLCEAIGYKTKNILDFYNPSLTFDDKLDLYKEQLINEFYNLKIELELDLDDDIINSFTEEVENNYKVNAIDEIIYQYKNFNVFFDENLRDIVEEEIKYLSSKVNTYEIFNEINDIITDIKKNYTQYFFDEIENYDNILKVFGFIDGLIYIPLEKINKLSIIWDYSPNLNLLRNLEILSESNKKYNFSNIIDYYKTFKKKYKNDILLELKNLMNENSTIKNLTQYKDTKDIFNSSCNPLSYSNISDMISILTDDIYSFKNILVNYDDYKAFKTKYESFKEGFYSYIQLIKINNEIFNDELSLFSYFNEEINYHYINDIYNFMEYNNTDGLLLNSEHKIINNIENNLFYEEFENSLIVMVSSKYNSYSNLINIQSKIITTDDIDKYEQYVKNIDYIDELLKIIGIKKIFNTAKNAYENIILPELIKIKNAVVDVIEEVSSNINNELKSEIDIQEDKKDPDKFVYGFHMDDYKSGGHLCYEIDILKIIKKFSEENSKDNNNIVKKETEKKTNKADDDAYVIKFRCPEFPFLQLRIIPEVILTACFEINYIFADEKTNYPTSILSFDINTGILLAVKIEGGIYLDDIKAILDISAAVGVQGTMFQGKVGLKFNIDFEKSKLDLIIYFNWEALSFTFYIHIKVKILFFTLVDYRPNYKLKTFGGYHEHNFGPFYLNNDIENNNKYYYLL